jgi:hypothetical protein
MDATYRPFEVNFEVEVKNANFEITNCKILYLISTQDHLPTKTKSHYKHSATCQLTAIWQSGQIPDVIYIAIDFLGIDDILIN